MSSPNSEKTFICLKPDAVQRGLIAPIIARFEQKGFKLIAAKLVQPSREHWELHYADLKNKKFFPGMIATMSSAPVFAMVWQGKEVVKTGRKLLGATNPAESAPGTIRGDYCIDIERNICHGSDSVENAEKEIKLWFTEGVIDYSRVIEEWIY